jgi:hypothetical protein
VSVFDSNTVGLKELTAASNFNFSYLSVPFKKLYSKVAKIAFCIFTNGLLASLKIF